MGTLGSKYYVSYYNNQPAVPSALQDTFVPLDVKSEPFCMSSLLQYSCFPALHAASCAQGLA